MGHAHSLVFRIYAPNLSRKRGYVIRRGTWKCRTNNQENFTIHDCFHIAVLLS
jgi:hypothetical protein